MANVVRSCSRCYFPNRPETTRQSGVRGSGDRCVVYHGEESPGSAEQRCRVTPGGIGASFQIQGKVPQKLNRLGFGQARAKRCGKSAPRDGQPERHGKPHREQDRIGTARDFDPRAWLASVVRVGCLSVSATARLEEWSPIVREHVDRTRLTDPLTLIAGVILPV
jgi:hypothetical protein